MTFIAPLNYLQVRYMYDVGRFWDAGAIAMT
jgi:hypothetical protein